VKHPQKLFINKVIIIFFLCAFVPWWLQFGGGFGKTFIVDIW
jgi:hypothetical protein